MEMEFVLAFTVTLAVDCCDADDDDEDGCDDGEVAMVKLVCLTEVIDLIESLFSSSALSGERLSKFLLIYSLSHTLFKIDFFSKNIYFFLNEMMKIF